MAKVQIVRDGDRVLVDFDDSKAQLPLSAAEAAEPGRALIKVSCVARGLKGTLLIMEPSE